MVTDEAPDLARIHEAGWPLPEEVWTCLPTQQQSFLARELGADRPATYYEQRLRAMGIADSRLVVDAGCGVGQWSLAASSLNVKVIGVDKSATRLLVATALANQLGIDNVHFTRGSIDEMPIPDGAAEALLCYSTLFLGVRVKPALAEFYRVLAPGGVLYCNVNDWGWYAHLLLDLVLREGRHDLIRPVSKMIIRTLLARDGGRVMSGNWLSRRLALAGFEVVHVGPEGSAQADGAVETPPAIYPPVMYGLASVVEVVARRRG